MGACQSKKEQKKTEERKTKYEMSTAAGNQQTDNRESLGLQILNGENGGKTSTATNQAINKIEPAKGSNKDLENLKKKTPFLPHIYNPLSKEDIEFYICLIEVKKENSNVYFPKSISSRDELKHQLSDLVVVNNNENIQNDNPIIEIRNSTQEEKKVESIQKDMKKLALAFKIFKWVTENIKYANAERNENYYNPSLDDIFIYKSASSIGIAKLFQQILSDYEIESFIISGYLKGSKIQQGDDLKQLNHEWNAVKLFGKYRLVDCSSACENSPYGVDISTTNSIKYPEFFFCTPPHHFIYTHYPEKQEEAFLTQGMMLLEKPVWEKLCIFRKFFFIYGFQIFDFKNCEIDSSDVSNMCSQNKLNEIQFSICLPEGIDLNLQLKTEGLSSEDTNKLFFIKKRKFEINNDKKKINLSDYFFIYEDFIWKTSNFQNLQVLFDNFRVHEITVRFPTPKKYTIDVLANKSKRAVESTLYKTSDVITNEMTTSDYCYSYFIDANCDAVKPMSITEVEFPQITDTFTHYMCQIIEPTVYHLNSIVQKRKSVSFLIKVPNADKVCIFYDDQKEFVVMTKRDEGLWFYTHTTEKKFQTLVIAASFSEDNPEFPVLVSYSI
jgi:hypothetical protein